MCDVIKPRLTTAEAAQKLACKDSAALLLLHAASVSFTRPTKRGAFLWDAAEVERLVNILGKNRAAESGVA